MVVIDSVILSPEEIPDDRFVITLIDPELVPMRGLAISVMLNYFIHLVAPFVAEREADLRWLFSVRSSGLLAA